MLKILISLKKLLALSHCMEKPESDILAEVKSCLESKQLN